MLGGEHSHSAQEHIGEGDGGNNDASPPSSPSLDEEGNPYDSSKKPGEEKKTGRRKINIEFIEDKSRRHITFSKRKAGIMKKVQHYKYMSFVGWIGQCCCAVVLFVACLWVFIFVNFVLQAYELSTLTGTQVLLLVASETGHVYTFATPKLQPLITKPEGKNLIQSCLNAPEAASVAPPAQHHQPRLQGSYNEPPPMMYPTSDLREPSIGGEVGYDEDKKVSYLTQNTFIYKALFWLTVSRRQRVPTQWAWTWTPMQPAPTHPTWLRTCPQWLGLQA